MTHNQPGTRGILMAYPISLHSRQVAGMTENERINFALQQIEMIYPGMRQHFGGVTKCWDDDQWSAWSQFLLQARTIQFNIAARSAAGG